MVDTCPGEASGMVQVADFANGVTLRRQNNSVLLFPQSGCQTARWVLSETGLPKQVNLSDYPENVNDVQDTDGATIIPNPSITALTLSSIPILYLSIW